jgi:hypothetical protein
MKKFNFFALLVVAAFMSCAKSDAPTPSQTVAPTPQIDVTTAIIGSWKLSSVGTLKGHSTSGGGCGSDSQSSTQISWETATSDEGLSFAKNGDFVQLKEAKQICKGTYQLNLSASTLKNDCANEVQNFSSVSEKSLTLDDGTTFLRFDKISSTPN